MNQASTLPSNERFKAWCWNSKMEKKLHHVKGKWVIWCHEPFRILMSCSCRRCRRSWILILMTRVSQFNLFHLLPVDWTQVSWVSVFNYSPSKIGRSKKWKETTFWGHVYPSYFMSFSSCFFTITRTSPDRHVFALSLWWLWSCHFLRKHHLHLLSFYLSASK